jgi:transposase-like protein
MTPSCLSAAHFHDERAAIDFVEARLWARGRECPHCGGRERHRRLAGRSTRPGLWKCYACRKPFTVKIGTLFENSHLPLHLWLRAIFLLAESRFQMSTHELHAILGVTFKTAGFMSRRIRRAVPGNVFSQLVPGYHAVGTSPTSPSSPAP